MGTDPNGHVQVFCKAIQANGEKNDVDIVNLFCFTLCDAISEWRENFMKAHQVCRFEELKNMFCKCIEKYKWINNVHGITNDKAR